MLTLTLTDLGFLALLLLDLLNVLLSGLLHLLGRLAIEVVFQDDSDSLEAFANTIWDSLGDGTLESSFNWVDRSARAVLTILLIDGLALLIVLDEGIALLLLLLLLASVNETALQVD